VAFHEFDDLFGEIGNAASTSTRAPAPRLATAGRKVVAGGFRAPVPRQRMRPAALSPRSFNAAPTDQHHGFLPCRIWSAATAWSMASSDANPPAQGFSLAKAWRAGAVSLPATPCRAGRINVRDLPRDIASAGLPRRAPRPAATRPGRWTDECTQPETGRAKTRNVRCKWSVHIVHD